MTFQATWLFHQAYLFDQSYFELLTIPLLLMLAEHFVVIQQSFQKNLELLQMIDLQYQSQQFLLIYFQDYQQLEFLFFLA